MKSNKLKKDKKTVKDYYVDPDEMWNELNNFYNSSESSSTPDQLEMSPKLGKMIDDIATKLGYMMKFINYSFKDEMKGDARLKMVKAVYDKNFTLWKTSPCSEVMTEGGREYVMCYLTESKARSAGWDDKKMYLKPWDEIKSIDEYHDNERKILTVDGKAIVNSVTYKNNPFSYYTKIAYHAFVNRIKKEKKVADTLHAYQEKVYDELYEVGNGWDNIKRQRDEDESDYYYSDFDIDPFFDDSCVDEDVDVDSELLEVIDEFD
jgi:hypothetical protein